MKRAAIGLRVHSGWGALVGVSGEPGAIEVIDRRRITIVDASMPGASQPYHFAKKLALPEAKKHLANCAEDSGHNALAALRELTDALRSREYRITSCAILLASGRPLPPLLQILASHALIHTAEGEFFRRAFWQACEALEIRVAGLRERDLGEHAKAIFGRAAASLPGKISTLGKSIGPPWTQDQKSAALAAWLVLTAGTKGFARAAL